MSFQDQGYCACDHRATHTGATEPYPFTRPDPARGGVLNPFDIVYARIWGASLVLLPWGLWLTWRDRLRAQEAGTPDMARAGRSLAGLSPLPLRTTLVTRYWVACCTPCWPTAVLCSRQRPMPRC